VFKMEEQQYIEVTPEKIELVSSWSSEFHKLFSEVMRAHSKDEKDLFYKLVEFTYNLTITVGVIAGFGFAGFGYVRNVPSFMIGEILLIGSIVYTVVQVKNIYQGNLTSVQKARERKFKLFEEKSRLFRSFVPKFVSSEKFSASEFNNFRQRLENADREIVDEFSARKQGPEKDESGFLNFIILFLIIGAGFILLSFVVDCI